MEWVPGRTRAIWWAALFVTVLAVGVVGSALVYFGTLGLDPHDLYPVRDAADLAQLDGGVNLAVILTLVFYLILVPPPAPRLGVCPAGLVLSPSALRGPREYEAGRVRVVGDLLYLFGNRWFPPDRYRLSRGQAERIRAVLPGTLIAG